MNKFKDFLKILRVLSKKLEKSIDVIPSTTNSEIVHDCRVAIRGMRGILKFYGKGGKGMDVSLKKIADDLSKIRDLDVQLNFFKDKKEIFELEKFYEEKLFQWDEEKLYLIKNLPKFDRKKFMKRCKKMFDGRKFSNIYSYIHLKEEIKKVLENLDEEIKKEEGLHLLRIKLKKTRYILEALSYKEKDYLNYVEEFKYFQDLLGEIHDFYIFEIELNSVKSEKILNYIQQEKTKKIVEFNRGYPQLLKLLENILNHAGEIAFPRYHGAKEEMNNLKLNYKEKRIRIRRIAQNLSLDFSHIERVENRCRKLLQKMGPFGKIKGDDLFILDSAALLHDIGQRIDMKNHNFYSKKIIDISRYLPLGVLEKEKIGWLVANHRGAIKNVKKMNKTMQILCGILRCADGMELEGEEYIKNFEVEIKEKDIIFFLEDASLILEKRFLKKSEFLGKVLNKRIKVKKRRND